MCLNIEDVTILIFGIDFRYRKKEKNIQYTLQKYRSRLIY